MSRNLRALRSAPARALSLGIVTAAGGVGGACITAYPASGSGRAVTTSGLVAIAVVVCLATATIVAAGLRARADNVRIVVVRGMSAGARWRWLLAEPLIAIAGGAAVAMPLCAVVVPALGRGGYTDPAGPTWIVGAVVCAGIIAAATAAVGCRFAVPIAMREPASSRSPVWLTALAWLVVAVTAWLLYRAATVGRDTNDSVIAMAPLLAALAVVVTTRWLARRVGAATAYVWSGTPHLGWYLAVRRLRRTAELAAVMACIAGAVVVVVFAGMANRAEAQWRSEMALVVTGGVTSYPSTKSAAATFLAARHADPDGRWLMAVEGSPHDDEPADYRGFADLSRWERVVGRSTNDDGVASAYDADTWNPVIIPDGRLRLPVWNTLSWPRDEHAYLNVSLLRFDGEIVATGLRLPDRRGAATLTGKIDGCAEGCVLRKLTVATQADAPIAAHGRIVLRSLHVGDERVDTGWRPGGRTWSLDLTTSAARGEPMAVKATAEGMELRLDATRLSEPVGIMAGDSHLTRRVIAASDTVVPEQVLGLDPSRAPAEVVARLPTLPVLGSHGFLGNLPDVVLDSYEEAPGSSVQVLARDDTPPEVLAALADRGIPTSDGNDFDAVTGELADTDTGRAALAWGVLAVAVGVVVVAVAVHGVAAERTRSRLDSARLRSAHVPPHSVARAFRHETLLLACVAAIPATLGALATWWCVGDAIVLATPGAFDPTVDDSMRWPILAFVAIAAFVVAGAGAGVVRTRDTYQGTPASLREAGSGR